MIQRKNTTKKESYCSMDEILSGILYGICCMRLMQNHNSAANVTHFELSNQLLTHSRGDSRCRVLGF